MPATVFVVSRFCGLLNNWPSQPPGTVPELPLLSWEELAHAPRCITAAAHTATHPRLPALSRSECDQEMYECREEIQQRLARPVRWLAYPYGSCTDSVCSSAARHFDLAVGTTLKFLAPGASPMNLPRIDMFYFAGQPSLDRIFSRSMRVYLGLRYAAREARGYFSN